MGESQRLREIIDIARVVVSSLDMDEALQRILRITRDLVDVPAGCIALYNEDECSMQLHASEGLGDEFRDTLSWSIKNCSLNRKVLAQKSLVVIEDSTQIESINNCLPLNTGIHSVIIVPLVLHEETVGILCLIDFVPRRFPSQNLDQLTIIASFASLSIVNASLHQQTKMLASTDGLTGLHNYRHFKTILEQELQRAQRYGHPLSMIMFDIDNFKNINDSFGHPFGDGVLVKVASTLSDEFRGVDLVFRYGGEEFTVLLPEANLAQAVTAAERTRILFAEMNIDWAEGKDPLPVTASAGVVSFPDDGISSEELLNTVDALLYRAKRGGKNCVYYNELTKQRASH